MQKVSVIDRSPHCNASLNLQEGTVSGPSGQAGKTDFQTRFPQPHCSTAWGQAERAGRSWWLGMTQPCLQATAGLLDPCSDTPDPARL